MENAFKDIAQRTVNAENSFVESVMNCGACTKAEAEKVMAYYLKHKIAKMDAVIGRISVKHGAYLDADVIRNAINA
jgi:hypothetical protein